MILIFLHEFTYYPRTTPGSKTSRVCYLSNYCFHTKIFPSFICPKKFFFSSNNYITIIHQSKYSSKNVNITTFARSFVLPKKKLLLLLHCCFIFANDSEEEICNIVVSRKIQNIKFLVFFSLRFFSLLLT